MHSLPYWYTLINSLLMGRKGILELETSRTRLCPRVDNKNEWQVTCFVKAEVIVAFCFVSHLTKSLSDISHQTFNNHVPTVLGQENTKKIMWFLHPRTLQSVSDTHLTHFLKRAYREYTILLCKKLNHFSSQYRRTVKFPTLFLYLLKRHHLILQMNIYWLQKTTNRNIKLVYSFKNEARSLEQIKSIGSQTCQY